MTHPLHYQAPNFGNHKPSNMPLIVHPIPRHSIQKASRSPPPPKHWTEIYAIYGIDEWRTPFFLVLHALSFSILSIIFFVFFESICDALDGVLPSVAARVVTGFVGSVIALSAICLFFAAGNFLHSSVGLYHEVAQRMVSCVGDWSTVRMALDVGCGRGILLNAVATALKKTRSSGQIVGLDRSMRTALSTLHTAAVEGVEEYVTCKAGDTRNLPFGDNYFDVVVSAMFVRNLAKERGYAPEEDAAERTRMLAEIVRVLKPSGVAVLWDLSHAAEDVKRLQELQMEDVMISERVTAFMASSHIVSFRKPRQLVVGSREVLLDCRCCRC